MPCFILYSKAKLVCHSRYSLTSYFCLLIPYDEKLIFFFLLLLLLEILVGLHRTNWLQLLQHQQHQQCPGIDLDYCNVECLALEMNQVYLVIFEIAPKYCISDCSVDYEGCSISSKGFSATVIDTMVISIKFTHFLHGMVHSFIELCKSLCHNRAVISEGDLKVNHG